MRQQAVAFADQVAVKRGEVRAGRGPGYCVIPMKGEVGVGITAEAVKGR